MKMSNNRFEDEFTVHLVSSASMEMFDSNTLASFRNFFNDEIQLSGDWRVALNEIILPTNMENIVNGNLTVYNLKDYEYSQKMSYGANVISRAYSGEKLAFMPGTFDTMAQLLVTIKRTVGLPQVKSSGKYEILLGKHEGITFPSEKIPSIIGFEGIPDGNGIHIGYKMNPNENRLMKVMRQKHIMGNFLPTFVLETILFASIQTQLNTNTSVTLRRLFRESLIPNNGWKTVVYVSLNQLIESILQI